MMNKLLIVLLCMSCVCSETSNKSCDEGNSLDISSGTRLENDEILYKNIYYKRSEYYIDDDGKERGCICSKMTCARKCCPFGFGYNEITNICEEVTEPFNPPVLDRFSSDINATSQFHFLHGKRNCTPPAVRIAIEEKMHLKMDGKLYVTIPGHVPPLLIRGPEEYCIDTFVDENPSGERTTEHGAFICYTEKQEEDDYVFKTIGMIISCVFILATCAVYAWLPELRNLHGRVLMAYLLCLFVSFAFLAAMQILLALKNISRNTCVAFTFIIYYSLLAAFFWLNVMCFDIWWTFSAKRGILLEKVSIRARFLVYCTYAFGIPTALTILLASLEFSNLPPHPLLPKIRHQTCFLHSTSKLIYLYGPMVVLCVANMVFFVLTAVKIAQIKRQTSVLNSKESVTHDQDRNDKQRLLLYVKLFAVMGTTWILEVISAIYPEAKIIWNFSDAYNALIGLVIFIIFVCKARTFKLIKMRYKQFRGHAQSGSQTTSPTFGTSSTRDEVQMGSVKSK